MLSTGELRVAVHDPMPRRLERRKDALDQTRIEVRDLHVRVMQRKRVVHDQTEVATKARVCEAYVGAPRLVPAFPADPVERKIQGARSVFRKSRFDPPQIRGSNRRSAEAKMKIVGIDVVEARSRNAAIRQCGPRTRPPYRIGRELELAVQRLDLDERRFEGLRHHAEYFDIGETCLVGGILQPEQWHVREDLVKRRDLLITSGHFDYAEPPLLAQCLLESNSCSRAFERLLHFPR